MSSETDLNEKVIRILLNKKNLKDSVITNEVDIVPLFLDTKISQQDENIIFQNPIHFKVIKKAYMNFYSVFTIGYMHIENENIFFMLRESVGYDDYWDVGVLIYTNSLFNLICHEMSYYEKLVILESEESELPDFSNFSI